MKEGYNIFIDTNPVYLELMNILIESILAFSNKDIEVFSINSDYKHSSNRITNYRVNLPEVNFATICYTKIYASLNSSFDFGIQLDGDFIITKEMDKLFEDAKTITNTPLGSLHPSDPNNQFQLMKYLGVTRKTQPYVHATYLYSKDCKPFFQECYDLSQYLYKNNFNPPNYDETILNTMLWKYGSKRFVDTYDPYFGYFLDKTKKEEHGYDFIENVNFYSCHGIKDPIFAREVFNKLLNNDI